MQQQPLKSFLTWCRHEAGILVDPRTIDQDLGDDVEADPLDAPEGPNLPVHEAAGQEKVEA